MKELAHTLLHTLAIHVISRYGVLGNDEVVTVARLPRRGVTSSVIGRTDIRTQPTQDIMTGLFVIASKSCGKYILRNPSTRIELTGVPRSSIRKILDLEP